jgi:hypothetical protein
MTDQEHLERAYRRLLAWYPREFRRENGQEVLAVLMAAARPGQRQPGLAESADLIGNGLGMRLRPGVPRSARTVRAAVRLMYGDRAGEPGRRSRAPGQAARRRSRNSRDRARRRDLVLPRDRRSADRRARAGAVGGDRHAGHAGQGPLVLQLGTAPALAAGWPRTKTLTGPSASKVRSSVTS